MRDSTKAASQITAGMRAEFLAALRSEVVVIWPILSVLLALKVLLGVAVGWLEGWSVGEGIYFAFITGLTIGYGDLTPSQAASRCAAVVIGFAGIVLTALVAAVAVRALQVAREGHAVSTPRRCARTHCRLRL